MIDIKTIFLTIAINSFLMSFITYGVANFQKNKDEESNSKGVLDLTFSYAILGIGLILTALKEVFPVIITSGLGSSMMMVSIYLIMQSIVKIKMLENVQLKTFKLILLSYILIQFTLVLFDFPFLLRTIIFSIFSGFFFLMSFFFIKRKNSYIDEDKSTRFANFIIIAGFVGYFVGITFRSLVIIANGDFNINEQSLLAYTTANVVLSLVSFFGFSLISFGFLFLFWQRTQAQLLKISNTDWLTQALNRKAVEQLLNKMYPLAEKEKRLVSFAVIDLDNFKKVNDLYGHAMGDKVLKDFAALSKKIIKKDDLFARFGGEEFLIVFFNKTDDQIKQIMSELLTEFVKINFETNDGIKNFTFSAGISSVPNQRGYEEYYKVIKQADDSLYKAKHSGKNCYVFY